MYKFSTKIGQAWVGQWCRTTLSINSAKPRVLPVIACDINVKRTYTEGASSRSYDVIKSSSSDVEIPNESLPEFLFKKFSKFPERQAVTCGVSGRSYTFDDLQNTSIRFAKALLAIRGANLKKNDTIAILLPNIPEFSFALFGALLAGIKVTFASPLNTPAELMRQFQTANVRLVVTIPPFLPLAGVFKSGLAGYRGTVCIGGNDDLNENIFSFARMISTEHKAELPTVSTNDVAIIPFSSGTSGLPKGVQLTHHNCIANLEQLSHPIFNRYHNKAFAVGNNTVLSIPPFFHIFGLNAALNLCLQDGANVVSLPQFKPEDYIKALLTYRPQILFVVPTLITFLAAHPSITKEMLSCVDQMIVGAAAASAELQAKMIAKCDRDVIILQGYGMTELSPVALLTPLQPLPGKTASVGKLLPNTQTRIISLTTGKPVGPNERGEIHFRGPQVMKGYLGNEEATGETIDVDGWLKTGDVAYVDDDGYFYIVDRTKELIKVKGYQVSPTELESLLVQLPEIADVAVCGIADEVADEVPRAYIVLRPNAELTAEKVHEHVKKNAAKHKWLIGGVQFVKAIPRNLSGKILRRNLPMLDKKKEF